MTGGQSAIAIIGGGIGGLTAALSLLRAGFDVHVYERVSTLREVGAGVIISPNATRILHRLGLAEPLARLGVQPAEWLHRRWDDGRVVLRVPLAEATVAAFGYPQYQCHRADLHAMLASAFPADRLHTGHGLIGIAERDDRVEAEFDNGTRIRADMLVGADGIHSAVRAALLGPDNPRFTGCIAYRGLVPPERLRHLDLGAAIQVWMGPGKHFVHYPVQAGRLLNFVCLIEQDSWRRESWTDRGEVADALAAYADWHPHVRAIIESVEDMFIWALFDRPPLPRWSVGRMTLLGDACHPMLPFMAQGAAQAIEDAATLTAIVARSGGKDIPHALRLYEAARLPRTAQIQGLATQNKLRFHLPDGPAQQDRDAQMASGSTDWSTSAIAWIFGHDAAAVDGTDVRLREA
jgi:2-polyprenyl-6-methoxyphenol hydroxylase-like FAD-dependent oxidoreductase